MFDTADLMKAITTIQTVTPPFIPPDAEVMTSIIEWPPGSAGAPPHRHPGGPSFGYVLEGEMLFELEGEAPRVIKAGEAFWEPGGDVIHYSDANNRSDIPLRFLVTMVCAPGAADARRRRRGRTRTAPGPACPTTMTELDKVVRERRSTRLFLRDKPVPRELLDEALSLAMRAPSNSNIQPWRVFIASGPRRDRLVEALLEAASVEFPVTTGIPETFLPLRHELGALVYGSMGIPRHDAEARRLAQLRNWEFFRAPVGAVVCMHRDLGLVDSLGVGMFLQTLLLALTERGLGTCVQVSIAAYPEILRAQLDIPDELTVLCGLAIGYPDPAFPANSLAVPRNPVETNVVFLDS